MTSPALLRRVARDQRGNSFAELALALPVGLFLLLGAADVAMGFASKLKLEQAATRAMNEARVTGQGANSYGYVQQEAATAAGVPTSSVTLDKWLECDGVRQASYSGSCGSGQALARYISVRIQSTYQPPFNYGYFASRYGATSLSNQTITGSARLRVQ